MKALTLHQPWASLIVVGAKAIETRSWSTKYRGPLAIHAGKHRPPTYHHRNVNWEVSAEYDLISMASCWQWTEHPDDFFSGGSYRWAGPLGAVVATCELVDCVRIVDDGTARNCVDHRAGSQRAALRQDDLTGPEVITDVSDQLPYGDFTPGRWAWLLNDVKPVDPPIPATGHQGLWTWESS